MDRKSNGRDQRLREHYGYHAFFLLGCCLGAGEILAMIFSWEKSLPRVLFGLCLAGGYYLCRCIWSGVHFRSGGFRAAQVLALPAGSVLALWRLLESFFSSRLSQDGIWSYRAVWIEGLIFCLTVLCAAGLKAFRKGQRENN